MDAEILHLMFALLTVSQAQDVLVSQPSSAQGTEGGSVTLHCSYNSTSKPKVGSFWWVKDPGLQVKNTTPEFMGRVNCSSDQHFLLDRRADVEIRDLRHYDSGIYRCVVMVKNLSLREATGNGTQLRVVRAAAGPRDEQLGDNNMILVWLFLRGFLYTVGIAVVALLTRLHYRKTIPQEVRKRQSNYTENEYRTATGNYTSNLRSSRCTQKPQLPTPKARTRRDLASSVPGAPSIPFKCNDQVPQGAQFDLGLWRDESRGLSFSPGSFPNLKRPQ